MSFFLFLFFFCCFFSWWWLEEVVSPTTPQVWQSVRCLAWLQQAGVMNAFKRQYLRLSTAEIPVEISTPALKQNTIISCWYSLSNFPSIVAHKSHRSQQCCQELHAFGVVYTHSIFNVPIRHFDQNLKPKRDLHAWSRLWWFKYRNEEKSLSYFDC